MALCFFSLFYCSFYLALSSADVVVLPCAMSPQQASTSSLGQYHVSEVFYKTIWCELCHGQQDAAPNNRLKLGAFRKFLCVCVFPCKSCLILRGKEKKRSNICKIQLMIHLLCVSSTFKVIT